MAGGREALLLDGALSTPFGGKLLQLWLGLLSSLYCSRSRVELHKASSTQQVELEIWRRTLASGVQRLLPTRER